MKKASFAILAAAIIPALLVEGCKNGGPVSAGPETQKSIYVTPPPPGKLPWPQHDPAFSSAMYNAMMDSLFIINDFGQYQAGTTKESVYFHDGLDVVLWNGTKIFAVDSGYVKAIMTQWGEYYQLLIIGNTPGSAPGYAWSYAHINNFQVKVGDKVRQGDYIADIHFQGVPHVHLSRVYLTSGSWSNLYDTRSVQPDSYFFYPDDKAPLIEQGFHYYRNGTDSLLGTGSTAVISGAADIVVGMREQGEYAHSEGGVMYSGYGDRLCVSKIEYEIKGEDGKVSHYSSFDFSKMVLGQFADAVDRVYTVYKFYPTVHPGTVQSWDKIYSYYVITNTSGEPEQGEVKVSDQKYSWRTDEKNTDGAPKWPDGTYTVTVFAWDYTGNEAKLSESVKVNNSSAGVIAARYSTR